MLFRRAIQLSVSGKHWAEVTCGPADPDAAAQSRGFVLFRGTMSYCRSAGQSDISGVFGMAIEATSSVAAPGLVSATRAITPGSATVARLKA